ncbi:MAG: hypothetical protein K5870_01020 [Lachnospiraceae bacterium]|nr:hypothetical protein [Lachnospiraceae bacterium]
MAFVLAQNGGGGSHVKVNYGFFDVAQVGGAQYVNFTNGTGDTDFKPSRIVVYRVEANSGDTSMRTNSLILVWDKNVYLFNKQYRFLVGSSTTTGIFDMPNNANNLTIGDVAEGGFYFRGAASSSGYGRFHYIAVE